MKMLAKKKQLFHIKNSRRLSSFHFKIFFAFLTFMYPTDKKCFGPKGSFKVGMNKERPKSRGHF